MARIMIGVEKRKSVVVECSAPACKARQGTLYPIPDPALSIFGHLSPNTWLS